MKRLILLGAGHAHVEVLRSFAAAPPPQTHVTVVSPYKAVPYTGMLPGVVSGRYSLREASIDAAVLANRAGADFVEASSLSVDRQLKRVRCDNGADISYDLLSINIGAVARRPLSISDEMQVIATKPAEPFIAALERSIPPAVTVIGGGYGGIELAAALAYRGAAVTVIAGRDGLAPGAPDMARRMIERRLAARAVVVIAGADAVGADASGVGLKDGRTVAAQTLVLAAGVTPPPLIATLGLPTDARGFLRVGATLQSDGDPDVFAAGDCASVGTGLAKAGVFAVREAPVLAANLRAALAGASAAKFRPQSDYLSILSFWPDGAVAIRGRLAAEGRWADRWKEAIDRSFVARYR
ncbi:MAG: FAD-dependent oxidoreductase [Parvularculaceae bacterium]|nr:FAD-dependent oxidoreductase [Parvularculaceae bacterium]